MTNKSQGVSIHYRRGILASHVILFAMFTLGGFVTLIYGEDTFTLICGCIVMIVGGLSTPLPAWLLFDRQPQISIGKRGIRLRSHSDTEIPWNDIQNFYVLTIHCRDYMTFVDIEEKRIVIRLTNPSIYPPGEGMSLLRSAILKLHIFIDRQIYAAEIYFPCICIRDGFLPIPLENVVRIMEFFQSLGSVDNGPSNDTAFPITVQGD